MCEASGRYAAALAGEPGREGLGRPDDDRGRASAPSAQTTRPGLELARRRALEDRDAARLACVGEPSHEPRRVDAGAVRRVGAAEHARDPHLGLDLGRGDEPNVRLAEPTGTLASSPARSRSS